MDGWVNEWVGGTQRNNQITAIPDITVMKFIFHSTFLFFFVLRYGDVCDIEMDRYVYVCMI